MEDGCSVQRDHEEQRLRGGAEQGNASLWLELELIWGTIKKRRDGQAQDES